MPAVPPGSKVLVTGANGFVAVWIVRTLLEQGFSVRGTIRSPAKGEHLKKLFKEYGDKLELVIVPNIEAVRDVDNFSLAWEADAGTCTGVRRAHLMRL